MKKLSLFILLLTNQLLTNAQDDVFHKTENKIKSLFGKKHKDENNSNNKENVTDADAAVKTQKDNLTKLYTLKSKDFKGAESINVIGAKGSYTKFKDKKCGGFTVGWDADDLIIKGIKDPQPYLNFIISLLKEWATENGMVFVDNKEVINGEEIYPLTKNNLSQGYLAGETGTDKNIKALRFFLNDSKYEKDLVITGNSSPVTSTSNSSSTATSTPSNFAKEEENLNKIYALKSKDYSGAEKEKFNSIFGNKGMYVIVTKEMGGFFSFSWELGSFYKAQTLANTHQLILQWADHNGITVTDSKYEDPENGHLYALNKDKKIGTFSIKRNSNNEISKVMFLLNDSKYTF